jgi:transposase
MPLPAAARLVLTDSQRNELLAVSRHRSTPRGIVLRVSIVLCAAEGLANRVIARKLSTSVPTVLLWRKRYERAGLEGILEDRPRSGRPKQISAEREAAIVEATMKTTPKNATHWSVRSMAASQKVSPATVQRIWNKHKLQPHRVESFKFSTDPEFAPKVRDIVGLYMNPPDKAIVLSVDEKSQIQALDRTHRSFRSGPACPSDKRMTTNGMEQPHCSPHSMFSKEPSSVNASRGIGIKSSYAFSLGLISQSIPAWTSISCWTITGPINIPK